MEPQVLPLPTARPPEPSESRLELMASAPHQPSLPARTLRALRERGLAQTARLAAAYADRTAHRAWFRVEGAWFDRRHGVVTRGRISPDPDDPCYAEAADGRPYEGIHAGWFSTALGHVPADRRECTFVDLGCGKGKALLLAARAGFARVVGVELSPALAAAARDNVRACRSPLSADIEVRTGNATTYDFPDGPLVVFMFNPFGEEVIAEVVANLGRSLQKRPRPVWVVYSNPAWPAPLDDAPFLRRVWSDPRTLTWGHPRSRCVVYRGVAADA